MINKIPWVRLGFAVLFFVVSFRKAAEAVGGDVMNPEATFASILCLVIGSIFLGSVLIPHASKPFTSIIDRIYFGSNQDRDEIPPLNLRLIRAYRVERCFARAAEECERQLEWHSLAPELWAELVLSYRGMENRAMEEYSYMKALAILGMERRSQAFDALLRDRDQLPPFSSKLFSQFER